MIYPVKFENIYYEKIWGGRDLEKFRDNLPDGNIGETWDIACHPNGMGTVANGIYKGMSFEKLISELGHDLVGTKISTEKFPLLVKLINSRDNLSVQVHPDDEYARKNENQFGKTEAWYVMAADKDAKLIVGTKNCSKEQFKKAIEENDLEKYLNVFPVKKGDAFLIKSGLVHAICAGCVIAEIQQSSDVTYRVYDYGRPREIHVEKALDVIDFSLEGEKAAPQIIRKTDEYTYSSLINSKYFSIDLVDVDKKAEMETSRERFEILTVTDGNGTVKYTDSETENVSFRAGDSILIPAALGKYIIEGKCSLLLSKPL